MAVAERNRVRQRLQGGKHASQTVPPTRGSPLRRPIPCAAISSPSVDVAAADNAFGFRLLNAVQKTIPSGNVVLSPVSAALDLSMVLNGAVGQTRQEMLAALSLSGSNLAAINAANAGLIKIIRTPATNVTLSVADSLWVDSRRATLRPDYVKQTRAWYDAELEDLDFSNPSAAQRINSWASKETQGRIPRVIDRIDPADLALLLNAVYFKGEWAQKFDETKTQQRDFTLAGGSVKQVPRMAQSGRFDYFETPQMQAIRLPFGEGDLVMEVLLPAKSSSLDALEAALTPEHWGTGKGTMHRIRDDRTAALRAQIQISPERPAADPRYDARLSPEEC